MSECGRRKGDGKEIQKAEVGPVVWGRPPLWAPDHRRNGFPTFRLGADVGATKILHRESLLSSHSSRGSCPVPQTGDQDDDRFLLVSSSRRGDDGGGG